MHSARVLLATTLRHMSKSSKKGEQKKDETKETPQGPVQLHKNGTVLIHVHAKPGAKANGITDIGEDGVGVQIAGKAVDGEANSELLKYMMDVLRLKKSELTLDKGMKSRQKTLVISKKDCTVESVISLLKEEIGK